MQIDQARNHQLARSVELALRRGAGGQPGLYSDDLPTPNPDVGDLVAPLVGVDDAAALQDEVVAVVGHRPTSGL